MDIFGLSLRGYGGRVVNVSLAGIPAQIKEEADLFVTVIAGVGSSVTGDVLLTSDAGATVTHVAGWSYVAAGTVSSVTPPQGQVGTMVTIFGTGLLSGGNVAVEVTLRGVRARIVSQNSTVIVVQAYPARQLGVGDLRIIADTGAFLVQTNAWTYVRGGEIDSVTPASGQYGTVVTMRGRSMLGGGLQPPSVTLAGTAVASVLNSSDTLLIVVADSSTAMIGDIVLMADTGATVTRVDGWEYHPARGQIGTWVIITGSRLLRGGSAIVQVYLASQALGEVRNSSDATVVVRGAGNSTLMAGSVVLVANTGATITKVAACISKVSPGDRKRSAIAVLIDY